MLRIEATKQRIESFENSIAELEPGNRDGGNSDNFRVKGLSVQDQTTLNLFKTSLIRRKEDLQRFQADLDAKVAVYDSLKAKSILLLINNKL